MLAIQDNNEVDVADIELCKQKKCYSNQKHRILSNSIEGHYLQFNSKIYVIKKPHKHSV